jgi:glycine cleavage system regulatory protein
VIASNSPRALDHDRLGSAVSNPTRSLVLTLLGPDRPGLVELLSELVTRHRGNWVDSRMARLGGQFAGILRVDMDPGQVEPFGVACQALERSGMRVLVSAGEDMPPERPLRSASLDLVGQDRPGIVREISRVLAERGVNVEELTTGVTNAPMSGEALFFAKARLGLPPELPTDSLRESLERLAADLMVDLTLHDAD